MYKIEAELNYTHEISKFDPNYKTKKAAINYINLVRQKAPKLYVKFWIRNINNNELEEFITNIPDYIKF